MIPRPVPIRTLTVDQLEIQIFATRADLGTAAAHDVAAKVRQLLAEQARVRMVFAAAPSQNEFLAALVSARDLDWGRIEAFHMDEYVGLAGDAPQSFGRFLRLRLYDLVEPSRVENIDGTAPDLEAECQRYSALLSEQPVDIVCAGIGENGHLAFNDPPVADFDDPKVVKAVTLEDACRTQQVHDGAFATINDVPKTALTLTVPALMLANWLYCMVPGPTKTVAVRNTLKGPISTACPATVMRRHSDAVLYLDCDAAVEI